MLVLGLRKQSATYCRPDCPLRGCDHTLRNGFVKYTPDKWDGMGKAKGFQWVSVDVHICYAKTSPLPCDWNPYALRYEQ